MTFAILIFALSLLSIILLFSLKAWEVRTSKVFAPTLREHADTRALELKSWISWSQGELKKLPSEMVFLTRTIVHDAALGAAFIARTVERQSHRLADLVSHKRGFERRETQSDFLKNVSDYKNGAPDEGNGLDTPDSNGQNS
ncbi:hypothetical protein K8R03_02640 [Candidatus Kaiserbacteria bacterium]|nr:hypothetical protein [Candidatus Kaiserbacteria bacterium]